MRPSRISTPRPGLGVNGRLGGDLEQAQLELACRRAVDALARSRVHRLEHLGAVPLEDERCQQLRHVHVLGGQPSPQDVVRVRHDLEGRALEVGVQLARGKEERFAGRERHEVEIERAQHGDVARVVRHEPRHPLPRAIGLAPARGLAGGALQDRRLLLGVQRHEPGEERAQGERRLLAGEAAQLRRDLGPCHRLEVAGDLVERPEALEGRERRQRADELGLVVGVAVVAARGVHGDALGVLSRPAAAGLVVAGVGLDRERLRGRQYLEEEGQLVAESVAHFGAEDPDRVVLDDTVEGAEARGCHDPRRSLRVRADPQLGLGQCGRRGAAQEVGDRRPRPPSVVLDRVVEDEDRMRHGAPRL